MCIVLVSGSQNVRCGTLVRRRPDDTGLKIAGIRWNGEKSQIDVVNGPNVPNALF